MNEDLTFHVKAFLIVVCWLLLYPAVMGFLMCIMVVYDTTTTNSFPPLLSKEVTLPLNIATYFIVSIIVFVYGKVTLDDHVLFPIFVILHLPFFLSMFVYELGKIPSLVFKGVWMS